MSKTKLFKALGLGVVLAGLSAGAASAAVATASANVREGPGLRFDRIDRLYSGEIVAIVDRAGSWCLIDHPGPDGWVHCSLLTASRFGTFRRFHDDSFDDDFNPGPSLQFRFGFGTGMGMHTHTHTHSSTTVTNGGMVTIY